MPRKREIEVEKHLSAGKPEEKIKHEKDPRLLERLYLIRTLYDGISVEKAAKRVGVVSSTGYDWLHRWNGGSLEGLKPNFGGGRPPKLSYEKREELKEILEVRDGWTIKETGKLVEEKFEVEYSPSHLRRILKSSGMKCGKHYPRDYRGPENAEEILERKMEKVLKDGKDCIT